MEKSTISIYRETKPAHYVGADCSITLKYKDNLPAYEIDAIEHLIITILETNDYPSVEESREYGWGEERRK